jgi:hypothetical protein
MQLGGTLGVSLRSSAADSVELQMDSFIVRDLNVEADGWAMAD